jgi:hypothetical protein
MSYYLQRTDHKWESVDKYVYDNWQKARNADDTQRYNGNRIIEDGGKYNLCLFDVQQADLVVINRFLGVKEVPNVSTPGGFLQEPEFIRMAFPRHSVLHQVGGGNYKKVG